MNQSSSADSGSFAPTVQFEKREIHPVFRPFPNFHLVQNLSLSTLADLIIGYSNGAIVGATLAVVPAPDMHAGGSLMSRPPAKPVA